MVYFGTKEKGVHYNKRKAVYGLIFNEKGQLLVLEVDHFGLNLPGGGIEDGEEEKDTLYRELLEETGCSIHFLHHLIDYGAYYYLEKVQDYFEGVASFYVGKIGKAVQEKIENTHHMKWIDLSLGIPSFFFTYHREAVRYYLEQQKLK